MILCTSPPLAYLLVKTLREGSSDLVAGTIEMPLDHFTAWDTRTFKTRYWINYSHYKGGPVFFCDVGEAGVSYKTVAGLLNAPKGTVAVVELARKYQGIAVVWEHRFYGKSMPFKIDESTDMPKAGYEAYKYLTNEQALEDAVYFATHFQPRRPKGNLTSSSRPWIWIGGSYAGVRAAMIRQRNPNVFFASWYKLAPVPLTMLDMLNS